ncbi:class I SAM-dependent methyltransferase [Methanogenium organophilum]|uniref:Class I SAM-dependent methyltransferase n=1 Tax=Methanogenium organophilum TaxID=2199 RepID=A0A9X9T6F1_METOG|nr:class I SAM-dependent methyltransferase [Methanogenium organophilum]WAI00338.1 class I SAM-dependent methyltransferase [Methanogenium organophilum]
MDPNENGCSCAEKDKGREHFDGIENEYERMIVQIVPSPRDFFGSVLSLIPDGPVRVLELGSGTGFVTAMLCARNPEAEITGIDLSPGMLEVAKAKPELSDVTFITGDFREVWGTGTFDVIFTTLCLHHLPDADRAALLKTIHDSLREGGVFVNGDVFAAECDREEALNMAWWRDAMQKNGLSAGEAEEMIQKRRDNTAYLDTISGYRQKMEAAGFGTTVHLYKNRIYSTFAGFR